MDIPRHRSERRNTTARTKKERIRFLGGTAGFLNAFKKANTSWIPRDGGTLLFTKGGGPPAIPQHPEKRGTSTGGGETWRRRTLKSQLSSGKEENQCSGGSVQMTKEINTKSRFE